jgi:hypothetical protein
MEPGIHWLATAVFAEPGSDTYMKHWNDEPAASIRDNQLIITSKRTNEVLFTQAIDNRLEQLK